MSRSLAAGVGVAGRVEGVVEAGALAPEGAVERVPAAVVAAPVLAAEAAQRVQAAAPRDLRRRRADRHRSRAEGRGRPNYQAPAPLGQALAQSPAHDRERCPRQGLDRAVELSPEQDDLRPVS